MAKVYPLTQIKMVQRIHRLPRQEELQDTVARGRRLNAYRSRPYCRGCKPNRLRGKATL